MEIIFEQLIQLFLFMFIGFVLGKKGFINHEHSKIISSLEIYLFLPCTI